VGDGRLSQWAYTTTRWAIYLRDGLACVYCRATIQALVKDPDGANFLTLDHVRPRTKAGSNQPSNLVTACYACNTLKGRGSLLRLCSDLGLSYNATRSRSGRHRRQDIERYRPAAKLLLGRIPGVPIAQLVVDHDWLVRKQWEGAFEQELWEHLQSQNELFCRECGGTLPHPEQDPIEYDDSIF